MLCCNLCSKTHSLSIPAFANDRLLDREEKTWHGLIIKDWVARSCCIQLVFSPERRTTAAPRSQQTRCREYLCSLAVLVYNQMINSAIISLNNNQSETNSIPVTLIRFLIQREAKIKRKKSYYYQICYCLGTIGLEIRLARLFIDERLFRITSHKTLH